MGRITEPQYGFTVQDLAAHKSRWYRLIRPDTIWCSFDEYLLWAKEQGWKPGYQLRKIDPFKPYGPDNSYWYCSAEADEIKSKLPAEAKISPFCRACTRECPVRGNGCAEWQEYFVLNWNLNIHRPRLKPTPKPAEDNKQQFFVYYHPDELKAK